ncbi:hypothetical protein PYCC9005_001764 [Savitreella phatthalungensis]
MITIYAISRLAWARRFFELEINQYLGKISFSLYLVHGPILYCIGGVVIPGLWVLFGVGKWEYYYGNGTFAEANPFLKEVAAFIALAVLLPLCLYAADVFQRYVDEPSVTFSKWLAERYQIEDDSARA